MSTTPQIFRKALIDGGAVMENIQNWASHYLYGTSLKTLICLSKIGIVYNPKGH